MTFVTRVDGEDRPARAFTDPQLIQFPQPIGAQSGLRTARLLSLDIVR